MYINRSYFDCIVVYEQDLNSEIERITKDYERQLKNLAASIEEEWSLKYKTQESQLEVVYTQTDLLEILLLL